MKEKTFFIIGVNGVGKSTLLPFLEKLLSPEQFQLHDFDERGVPDNADKAWRISETAYWIGIGNENRKKGISTVVCGFAKPNEITGELPFDQMPTIILLDADERTIEQRLRSRYLTEESVAELQRTTGKTVEKFIMDNQYIASLLKKDCESVGGKIVNTTDRKPEEIANEISQILYANI